MEDWTAKTDEEVFAGAGEQPGSQAAYWRETEIKRRLYLLELQALQAALAATGAQQEATRMQREAIAEMRVQSYMMLASVGAALLAAVVTLIAGGP